MIIGLTGTNGAGKGTVVEHLKGKGFTHFSAREYIVEEIKRRGLPIDRTNMNFVGNDLRKQGGVASTARALFARAQAAGGDAIIESIRNIGEAEFLKAHGAYIFAVDADRKLRYERAVLRGSATDKVSFEEFCAQEDKEMAQTAAYDMNVFGVMNMADAVIQNNGTLDELRASVDAALERANATAGRG